jgi:hypothetical protein
MLFLDARLALGLAEDVGNILFEETDVNPAVADFQRLAQHYFLEN